VVKKEEEKEQAVPKSVLQAIKEGFWDFEPPGAKCSDFDPTGAMPGTRDKLDALASRIECGLPLWHPDDREDIEGPIPTRKPR